MLKNILTDAVIEFTEYNSYQKYPKKLRLVKFYDEEQGMEFAFITKAFHLTDLEIVNIYKIYFITSVQLKFQICRITICISE